MGGRNWKQAFRRVLALRCEQLEQRELLAADALDASIAELTDPAAAPIAAEAALPEEQSLVATRARGVAVPEPLSSESRPTDGVGNNLDHPEYGAVGDRLIRVADADYGDGVSTLAGQDRPSPRQISNALAAQDPAAAGNARQLSAFVYVWGQFLDHDIDLSETAGTESAPIVVPTGDPLFDPAGTGEQLIDFYRSTFDVTTGDGVANPREQLNAITAFIDGSQVYGSDQATADSLRTFTAGKLTTSENGLLPMDDDGAFVAGDVRANENIELTSMHTLFVREHNWWAERIAQQSPGLGDEAIYQQARAIVIAELQAITFEEFLPALLGDGVIAEYAGYDPHVDPGIANEFSTAAYRLGHSLLNDDVEFFGNDGRAVFEEVSLAEAFENPQLLIQRGIDPILKYAASSQSQELDNQVVDSVRNFLFGEPGAGGLDLASLNIQRGRDHGLADYNTVREAYGLPRMESFADVTSDVGLQQTLEGLYGSVDNVDLWVGSLAEDHVPGGSVGELVQVIVADQFTRLRAGDRFWYEHTFSSQDVNQLRQTTLADVIRRNTTVTNLQDNVFRMTASVSGTVTGEAGGGQRRKHGGAGQDAAALAGVAVELLNDAGEVVDATVTNSQGFYLFDRFLETGDYQIRVALPSGNGTTVPQTADVLISVGSQVVRNVDFGPAGGGKDASLDQRHRDSRRDTQPDRRTRLQAHDAVLESGVTTDPAQTLTESLDFGAEQRPHRRR
ncbi:MAG: hypothetical protein KDA63_03525 [Planctomycetales bacterium]|nr:hypothetical protein [Planctomycetales bacterium]